MANAAQSSMSGPSTGVAMELSKPQLQLLPRELQNIIYTAELVKTYPIRPWESPPGLLDSCRWVRSVCLPIYYLNNVFRIELWSSERVLFELWNQRLTSVRAELTAMGCTQPIRFQVRVEILVGRINWVSDVLELKDEGASFYETFEEAYQSYKSEVGHVSDNLMGLRWIYLYPELKKYVIDRPKPVDLSPSVSSHPPTATALPPASNSADSAPVKSKKEVTCRVREVQSAVQGSM
ncbi:hypothetical protein K490DRAFT_53802 [Saccharata proteae CBS 121410]|uniref:Uncharacterized protein n=1 Tax=Saccharata proteae CBS 121410 TaxID=1314787 RepID=A0A9P4M149_9PEZI|nr:hypothetical protein K490DRAFT_53802 [Saccharata proteae CBS 121410]